MAGTVCSASVRGPTHHVRVPSDNRPAISSIRGPSAATTIGNGMAPLHREGAVRAELLAAKRDRFAARQRPDDLKVFLGVLGRLRVVHAVHALDHDLMRRTDAEREATAARRLRRERLLGEHHRMTGIGRHDRCSQLDRARLATDQRERRQGVEPENLRAPIGVEAIGLRGSRLRDDRVDLAVVDGATEDADPHGSPSMPRSGQTGDPDRTGWPVTSRRRGPCRRCRVGRAAPLRWPRRGGPRPRR